MQCARCRQDNPAGVRFCGECGDRLEAPCPSCFAGNPQTNRFCHQCGDASTAGPPTSRFATPETYTPKDLCEKILISKATLDDERKQVTVLFADLRGSPACAEHLTIATTMYRKMDMRFWLDETEMEMEMEMRETGA